jgi:hypothetical protein
MKNNTHYIKKGRKYIPIETYDINGVSEGLWLVIKQPGIVSYSNILYAVKTHSIQDVGKFADFYKAHKDKLQKLVNEEYENFCKIKKENNEGFSISELTDCIIAGLSKIED